MINSYTNNLNEKISSRITDNTIMELQKELLLLSEDNLNVYDFIKYSQNKEKDPKKTYLYNTQENNSANNYNLVLKLFLQDLIMRNSSDLQVLKNKKIEVFNCKNCNCLIDSKAKFCPECGSKIEVIQKKYCSTCNTELSEGAKFCPECGTKVS